MLGGVTRHKPKESSMDHMKGDGSKKGAFALFLSGGKKRDQDDYSHMDKGPEERNSDTDEIAKDLIDAVKAGDAMGVAHALKAFLHVSKKKEQSSDSYMRDKDSYRPDDRGGCGCG